MPTVSLHVHERIDPKTVIEAVRKKNGAKGPAQLGLFESPDEKRPLREAIDFYKHPHAWSHRMVAGDSLLEKEGMAGKVQMVYIDPDEVFGAQNLAGMVVVRKTAAVSSPWLGPMSWRQRAIIWFGNAKDIKQIKYRQLYSDKSAGDAGAGVYSWIE